MSSRVPKRKKMLALSIAVGAGLALLGTVAMATNPFVLDWRVLGTGTVTGTCETSFGSGCTSISTGSAQGTHIGAGGYTLTLTAGSDNGGPTDPSNHAANPSGGKCLPANGINGLTNNIAAADGSTINFNTVGWLCEEGASAPTITTTERTASREVRAGSRVPWGEEAWWPPSRRAGFPTTLT